jgi:hypothetical protein
MSAEEENELLDAFEVDEESQKFFEVMLRMNADMIVKTGRRVRKREKLAETYDWMAQYTREIAALDAAMAAQLSSQIDELVAAEFGIEAVSFSDTDQDDDGDEDDGE